MNKALKVFIAGAPRTGTSILLFALKDVFKLEGYGESHVMPAFGEMIHACYKYIERFEALEKTIAEEMMVNSLSFPDVQEHIYKYARQLYQDRFPSGSWVDKTPSPPGVFSLAVAESVFPDAKLIVTYRNGIEVVSSHVKKFNVSFEEACEVWASTMTGLTIIKPLCKNLLAVDQFNFVNATEHVSKAIAEHLGRAEKMEELASYLRNQRVEQSSEHDWGRRLRLADTSWAEEAKSVFREKCGMRMEEYGYEL